MLPTPRPLTTALPAAGVVLWACLVIMAGVLMHSPVSPPGVREPPPSLHADEGVQWSLAKESAEGVPYSVNRDRFHGPALALATRGVFALRGLKFEEASESDLRMVPFLFYLLVCAAPLALRDVSLSGRFFAAALLLFGSAGCYFGHYFVQEALLVAGFVWGVLLWAESDAGRPDWWAGLSGAAFGLALACKVTAVAYLGVFLLALLGFARSSLRWRRVAWAAFGAALAWAFVQTYGFTDWRGLSSWFVQFQRSFAVASGNEDTLALTNPGYWWGVGLWLTLLVLLRFLRAEARTMRDVPLALAVGCFLFHLALPYKTPWLLFLPVCLSLVFTWPALAEGSLRRRAMALACAALFLGASALVLERHTDTRFEGDLLSEQIGRYRDAWQKQHPGRPFYIAVAGGHYWPLPYYLRSFQVGFGEFEGAETAPVRFLPALDGSRPSVPGHRTYSLTVRDGEQFWLLLQDVKGVKAELDAPGLR